MLNKLQLQETGPASLLEADFASRLNLITGDNGLGKTFLLDTAWFALTGNWCLNPATPRLSPDRAPQIKAHFDNISGQKEFLATWHNESQTWRLERGRPSIPGLIVYAQVDGGFSVWDPIEIIIRRTQPMVPLDLPPTYFAPMMSGMDSHSKMAKRHARGLFRTGVIGRGIRTMPFIN